MCEKKIECDCARADSINMIQCAAVADVKRKVIECAAVADVKHSFGCFLNSGISGHEYRAGSKNISKEGQCSR
jgi:hypothetical protein